MDDENFEKKNDTFSGRKPRYKFIRISRVDGALKIIPDSLNSSILGELESQASRLIVQ